MMVNAMGNYLIFIKKLPWHTFCYCCTAQISFS